MKKYKVLLFLVLLAIVQSFVETLSIDFHKFDKDLIAYDSRKIRNQHEKSFDNQVETFYFSPFHPNIESESSIKIHQEINNSTESDANLGSKRLLRSSDAKFRGKPKTIQEVWARNFNTTSNEFSQSLSLLELLKKIITLYMAACVPVVLYDEHVEKAEGFILQKLFESFPSTFIHGRIGKKALLTPKDSKCRSYVLFISDASKTREVIGPQIDNRVLVIPQNSTQWKLQEFLSSPESRDIINLLVVGESYSADRTKERPLVLYTHQLFTDGLGSSKAKVLTSWLKGRLSRKINLFPTKLTKGFAGHRFSVSAANFPPFVFKILKTDGVGNVHTKWDGYEYRVLKVLGHRLNFTFDVTEPRGSLELGPGDAVGESIMKRQFDIGMSGMYVTMERRIGMEMSVSYGTDCAAFITLASKALPRYRAILGPFQWEVWLCLTLVYLLAIIPLAYTDTLSIRYLIENPGQIENMFWYVFGTFTNSLTFSGEMTWSSTKKTSTRLLIGFYWIFTIIITACYTGSIIAFVTLPIFPETVDTIEQLQGGFYRIGTLDRGGWERWFLNSSTKETTRLLKNLEFVRDIKEGLGNVTKPYFLFPYAFIASKLQLEYLIQSNYTDDKMLSRRSALHISDQCFALFGTSFAFQMESVYRQKLDAGILLLLQSGIIEKIKNDVRWDMLRLHTGKLGQVSTGKALKIASQEERGLTLADTEGMFLLLGIGFLVAGGVLISEWVGGCTNKCMQLMKVKKEKKREEHRLEEFARVEAEEVARLALRSASSIIGLSFIANNLDRTLSTESISHLKAPVEVLGVQCKRGSNSSSTSKASQNSVHDLSSAMLTEMFHGPKDRPSNIVMINGKMMSEQDAAVYASESKENDEILRTKESVTQVSKTFEFLNSEDDGDEDDEPKVCQVEINFQAPTPTGKDVESFFGDKVQETLQS